MIKAVIFDLDGVIVDTAHYHFIAWKRLADELGVPFNEHDNERLKGVSRMQSMDIILELGALHISMDRKAQLADKKNTWFVEFVEKMKPSEIFPGVKQLLEELKSQGIKIALASSSKNARRVIELLQIENEFDAVVDGTMIVHTKPDPEIFLLASTMINVPASQCVVFEDAEAGVEAALAAGMKCVGVGSTEQLGKANRVVKRTADFKSAELQQL
ncbi:MAG TPA: beta-phosphoglucomutase [Cyclobacteriaceae bacterium]|nr:beta-phosphoglucomutase [Cyclobacteriaceae bacterium]